MTVRRIVRTPAAEAPTSSIARRRTTAEPETEQEEVNEAPRTRRNNAADTTSRFRGRSTGLDGEDESTEEEGEDLSGVLMEGWKGAERAKAGTGSFAEEFKVTKERALFKCLEADPFVSYKQHWIDGIKGKKSWPCIGADCPLCEIGASLAAKSCFNVFDMQDGLNKILILGVKGLNLLEALDKDRTTGPIGRSDMYYAIANTGDKQQASISITSVKERDVKEDWGVDPLSEEEIDKFTKKCFTKKAIPVFGRKKLLEIAKLAQA